MIEQAREYFKKVIREIDSDMRQEESNTEDSPIDLNSLDSSYKLLFGTMKPSIEDATILSTLPVTMVIYKHIGTNTIEDFDKGYCKAIDIHALAQDKTRLKQDDIMKMVECDSVEPQAIDTDDKAFKFTLQFTVTMGYKYEK